MRSPAENRSPGSGEEEHREENSAAEGDQRGTKYLEAELLHRAPGSHGSNWKFKVTVVRKVTAPFETKVLPNFTEKFPGLGPVVVLRCADNSDVESSPSGMCAIERPRNDAPRLSSPLSEKLTLAILRAAHLHNANRNTLLRSDALEVSQLLRDGVRAPEK